MTVPFGISQKQSDSGKTLKLPRVMCYHFGVNSVTGDKNRMFL